MLPREMKTLRKKRMSKRIEREKEGKSCERGDRERECAKENDRERYKEVLYRCSTSSGL